MRKHPLTVVLDLLFPPRCPFCRAFLGSDDKVCAACKDTLPYLHGEKRLTKGDYFSYTLSPLSYESMVRDALHRYKFEGKAMYADSFALILAESIAENLENCYDVLSYIPVSKARKRKRGYDQGKLLAEACAKILDMPLVCVLEKTVDVKAQSSLGGLSARAANIKDAYQVVDASQIRDRRVLLIDDISTTGATLSEAARCLLKAGAHEVIGACLARALEKTESAV